MFCSKCGKEIDDKSMFCSYCGAKQVLVKENTKVRLQKTKKTEERTNKEIVNAANNEIDVIEKNELKVDNDIKQVYINCPKCGNENIQKFSIVYLNGIGKIDGTTIGLGTGGLYGGLVNGKSQTALSEITAPPKKKWVIRRFLLMNLFMTLFTSRMIYYRINDFVWFNNFSIIFLSLIIPILYAVRGYIYNKKIYQTLYYLWDKKYLCLKCGQWFYLDDEKDNLILDEEQVNRGISKWRKLGKLLLLSAIVILVLYFSVTSFDMKKSGYWSSNGNYYYNSNGKTESNKLITYHGKNYYILEGGKKLVKSWKEIDNELYYFNAEGIMVKSKWIKYDGSRFHVNKDGKLDRNKWIGQQYVGADGKMLVNTITPDGKQVGEDGKIIK